MPSQYNGLPATVANSLPGTVDIASSTNASPIVITTVQPHRLKTGDWFLVAAAADSAANGVWRAGAVTTYTAQLLDPLTGGASTGTMAGGAAGNLFNMGFAVTSPILSDGDPPDAVTWNVPYQALFDRTAYLLYAIKYAMHVLSGGQVTFDLGSLFDMLGSMTLGASSTLTAASGSQQAGVWNFISTSLVKLLGRKVLRRARVPLTAADHTVAVTDGDRFELPDTSATPKVITLKNTSPSVPAEGETMEFLVARISTPGEQYVFRREGSSDNIASFVASGVAVPNTVWAEFEYVSGAWRLGGSSGGAYDGTDDYGVLPGLDA